MKTETIKIKNMHCAGCVRNVENAISQIEGVISTKANLEDATVIIKYNGGDDMPELFRETLIEWGYPEDK